ncbi:MAG: tannase/feruloyl esterase family alpha/beta hydrolase [Vicinamibacterales bacterium]
MTRLLTAFPVAAALATSLGAQAPPPSPSSCDALATIGLPDTTITKVETRQPGSFTPPAGRTLSNLPGFCRVAATSAPAVRFEVWLPLSTWNGKFQGVGNGANAGSISYDAMGTALRRGYAVASTDTGHQTTNGRDAQWALGHPELVEDFGHRALHITTEHAKAIVTSFYRQAASRSYYVGCSTGGRQGLMEAQRYPQDYDGLITGAPAANWTRFQAGGHLWAVLALNKDPESYVPAAKLPIIEKAVNAACDAMDGVADGVLNESAPVPLRCAGARLPKRSGSVAVSDAEAGNGCESDLDRAAQQQGRADLSAVHARRRSGGRLGDLHDRFGSADRQPLGSGIQHAQVHGVREPILGLPYLRLRPRHCRRRSEARRVDERVRSGSLCAQTTRRQAAAVSRLERSLESRRRTR